MRNEDLRWMESLTKKLRRFQLEGKYCDASLEGIHGACVKVHWLILAAASSKFSDLEPPITLKCDGCDVTTLKCVTEYMYSGSINADGLSNDCKDDIERILRNLGLLHNDTKIEEVFTAKVLDAEGVIRVTQEHTSSMCKENESANERSLPKDSHVIILPHENTSAMNLDHNDEMNEKDNQGIPSEEKSENSSPVHAMDTTDHSDAEILGPDEAVQISEEDLKVEPDDTCVHIHIQYMNSASSKNSSIKSSSGADSGLILDTSEIKDDLPQDDNQSKQVSNLDISKNQNDNENREISSLKVSEMNDILPQNVIDIFPRNSTESSDTLCQDTGESKYVFDENAPESRKSVHPTTNDNQTKKNSEGENDLFQNISDEKNSQHDQNNASNDTVVSPPRQTKKLSKMMFDLLMKKKIKASYIEPSEIEKEDGEIMQYTCSFCKLCFESTEQEEFIEHKKDHVEMRPFQCPICLERFKLNSDLHTHRLNHSINEVVQSTPKNTEANERKGNISQATNDVRSADIFKSTDTTNPFVTVRYNATSSSTTLYEEARKPNHPEIDVSSYVLKSELINKGEYRCSICQDIKRGYENFLAHKLKHANVVPFHCRFCNKGWYRKSDCKRHESKQNCGKNRIGAMDFYTETADGQRKPTFIKNSEIIRENDRKFYQCQICEKKMINSETFLAHKFDHAGVRPFACNSCGKTYTRLSDIKRHLDKKSPCHNIDEEMARLKAGSYTKESETQQREIHDIGSFLIQVQEFESNIEGNNTHLVAHDNVQNTAYVLRQDNDGLSGDTFEEPFVFPIGYDYNVIERLKQALHVLDTGTTEELMENLRNASGLPDENDKHNIPQRRSFDIITSKYILPSEKIKRGNKVMYSCSICNKTFKSAQSFAGHKMRHNNEKPFKCSRCPKGFTRKHDLKQHIKLHNFGLLHPCQTCKEEFTSASKLITHYLSKKTSCQMPNDVKWNVKRNNLEVTAVRSHICSQCAKTFKSKQELALHVRNKHAGTGMPVYECEQCNAVLTTKLGYVMHMKRHANSKDFSCETCGKKFLRNCDLQVHLVKHSDSTSVECPECSKSFKHRNSLRTHMLLHSGQKPFLCKVCGKAFAQKGNLEKHEIETHAESQNYSCKLCQKRFYTEGGMRLHVRSCHTTERPFVCKICLKGFIQQQNLKRHMLTHSDERPFGCPLCTKSFRVLAHARRHCMNVHGMTAEEAKSAHITAKSEALTLDPSANTQILQGSSLINIGGETLHVNVPLDSSVPTLHIIGNPDEENFENTQFVKTEDNVVFQENGQEISGQVLMMIDNGGGDLAAPLAQQYIVDDQAIVEDTSAVPSEPMSHGEVNVADRNAQGDGGLLETVATEKQVMYFIKYN